MSTKIQIDTPMSRSWEISTDIDPKDFEVKPTFRRDFWYQIISFTIGDKEYEVEVGSTVVRIDLVRANGQPIPKYRFGDNPRFRGLERVTGVNSTGAPLGETLKKNDKRELSLNGVKIIEVKSLR
ncbi:hypothetical protein [Shimazuella alba]|uniref:Uncharacterized protein n=1 Tax=Shimazuella alba TaxID=2690964 RepID=A0A6I4VSB1_9BACL|nr:hypothetical protein [Shimazuella alba]MXQ54467.1 hypothetical protein [Shimazuella alba]